jgi:hypothetical protein
MRVTPISEEEAEAQSANLWPESEYDYEVRDASEETSKNTGNEMIKLEIWVFNQEGGRRLVFDYLVGGEKSAWKVRKFAASCGLLPQFEKGDLIAPEIVGRTGRCKLGIQPAKDGYQAKNVVRDYIKAASAPEAAPPSRLVPRQSLSRVKTPAGDIDDEIPF